MTRMENDPSIERRASESDDRPRVGWAEQFALMAERGDDRLLDDGGPATAWDETDWEW